MCIMGSNRIWLPQIKVGHNDLQTCSVTLNGDDIMYNSPKHIITALSLVHIHVYLDYRLFGRLSVSQSRIKILKVRCSQIKLLAQIQQT